MSDELVKQSIAELQDIVHCDCGSAYLERGRHSHSCLHYMANVLKIVTDRIEELEANLAKAVEALEATLDCIGALSKPHELYGHGLQEDEIKGIFDTLAELKGESDA